MKSCATRLLLTPVVIVLTLGLLLLAWVDEDTRREVTR